MKRKLCPLLVQADTNPSMTIEGKSWTQTYFWECLGEECAAYNVDHYICERFYTNVKKAEVLK